jgi:hypothetical protein
MAIKAQQGEKKNDFTYLALMRCESMHFVRRDGGHLRRAPARARPPRRPS